MFSRQGIRHIEPNIMPGAGILGANITQSRYQVLSHKPIRL
jgi:hypothetical protein